VTVGALELGGSHVSTALVDIRSGRIDGARRLPLEPAWPRERLLAAIADTAETLRGVPRIGAAVPGPFDYELGVCTIRGVGKLEALYGLDLRRALAAAAGAEPSAVRFLNDAQAFVLGDALAGAARNHRRVIGLTLGTGLGSAFLADGEVVLDGHGVPPRGELYAVPFRDRAVEDFVSGRGLTARYDGRSSAVEIASRARAGDVGAAAAYAAFGADLAEFLDPWLRAFRPTCVVVGGSIARAWPLFAPALPPEALLAHRLDDAALIGAAHYAARA
jgi:glucokinase